MKEMFESSVQWIGSLNAVVCYTVSWFVISMVYVASVWRITRKNDAQVSDLERTLDSVREDRDNYLRGFQDRTEAYTTLHNKYMDLHSDRQSTIRDLAEATARIRVLEGQLKAEKEKVTATELRARALSYAVDSAPDTVDGSVIAENAKLFYRFLSGRA